VPWRAGGPAAGQRRRPNARPLPHRAGTECELPTAAQSARATPNLLAARVGDHLLRAPLRRQAALHQGVPPPRAGPEADGHPAQAGAAHTRLVRGGGPASGRERAGAPAAGQAWRIVTRTGGRTARPSRRAATPHLPQEARSVLRARKAGVPAPALYSVEQESASIYMERVEGRSIRHLLADGALDDAGAAAERARARAPRRVPRRRVRSSYLRSFGSPAGWPGAADAAARCPQLLLCRGPREAAE
jgi:hypothetical protein